MGNEFGCGEKKGLIAYEKDEEWKDRFRGGRRKWFNEGERERDM